MLCLLQASESLIAHSSRRDVRRLVGSAACRPPANGMTLLVCYRPQLPTTTPSRCLHAASCRGRTHARNATPVFASTSPPSPFGHLLARALALAVAFACSLACL
jgi:hypothetical protein